MTRKSIDIHLQRARREWKKLRARKHWARASYLKKFIALHEALRRECGR